MAPLSQAIAGTNKLNRIAGWACGALAIAMGLSFAFYLFAADMLLDQWSWWRGVTGDNATGLIGSLYLAQDEWRWPITVTRLFNPPEGVNIVFTDPVPIAALLGKLSFKLTGDLPLYMGKWILLSYALQSLIAWLIFRQLGLPALVALAAAALILLVPSFIARIGHIGLVAHFIVLASILFYLRSVSVARTREIYLHAIAIGSVLCVNPYLLAMSATIFIAGVLEATLRRRISWYQATVAIFVMGLVAGVVAFAFGIIGQGGHLPSMGGFGHYSMNLLSPIVPQVSAIPGFGSMIDSTGGQYEGFNYLGAGSLLLLAFVLVFRFPVVRDVLLRNRILMVALIGLTLYAASSKIYAGSWLVADLGYENLPVLKSLTSVFRSSGRFFWPVSYFIIIGATAVALRTMNPRFATALIVFAVAVQAADIAPVVTSTKAGTVAKTEIDVDAWTQAAEAYHEFTLYPEYHCVVPPLRDKVLQLQLIAARAGIPVNGAYTNRLQLSCSDTRTRVLGKINAASVTSKPLVIIFDGTLPIHLLKSKAAEGLTCRKGPFAFVCGPQTEASNPVFAALGQEFETSDLPLGAKLSVGEGSEGIPFLGDGWSVGDHQSRWAEGNKTSFFGRLAQPVCDALSFEALVTPLSFKDYSVRRARVFLNGEASGTMNLEGAVAQVVRSTIPLNGRCIQDVMLELKFSGLKSPNDIGMNPDVRKLSLLFNWFSFSGH
jgi:hypothetical protein